MEVKKPESEKRVKLMSSQTDRTGKSQLYSFDESKDNFQGRIADSEEELDIQRYEGE